MYKVQTLNKIAKIGLNVFDDKYTFGDEVENPDGIILRSFSMHDMELPKSVKDYEPHLALHGGTDGLDFYRSIASKYAAALKPGGYLCFEFGMEQGDAVCKILEEYGYTVLERSKDYSEIERAVLAQYDRKED